MVGVTRGPVSATPYKEEEAMGHVKRQEDETMEL